jgi:hypothetical protein
MYLLPILSIFPLITAALILVPFRLCLDLTIDGFSATGFYKVKWFGLTLRRAKISGPEGDKYINKFEDKKKTGDRTAFGKEDARKKDTPNRRSKFYRQRYFKDPRMFIDALPSFFRVLKDLMETVHIERLFLNIALGLDDPANTAVLCGYLWSMVSFISIPATIRIEPYFAGERLDGSLNAEIWGRLLWVLLALFSALREKPVRRLLKEMSWKGFRDLGNKAQIKRPLFGPRVRSYENDV